MDTPTRSLETLDVEETGWLLFYQAFSELVESKLNHREKDDITLFTGWEYTSDRGDHKDIRFEIDRQQVADNKRTANSYILSVGYAESLMSNEYISLNDIRIPEGSSVGKYRVIIHEELTDGKGKLDKVFLEIVTGGPDEKDKKRTRLSLYPILEGLKPVQRNVIDGIYEAVSIAFAGKRKTKTTDETN